MGSFPDAAWLATVIPWPVIPKRMLAGRRLPMEELVCISAFYFSDHNHLLFSKPSINLVNRYRLIRTLRVCGVKEILCFHA